MARVRRFLPSTFCPLSSYLAFVNVTRPHEFGNELKGVSKRCARPAGVQARKSHPRQTSNLQPESALGLHIPVRAFGVESVRVKIPQRRSRRPSRKHFLPQPRYRSARRRLSGGEKCGREGSGATEFEVAEDGIESAARRTFGEKRSLAVLGKGADHLREDQRPHTFEFAPDRPPRGVRRILCCVAVTEIIPLV